MSMLRGLAEAPDLFFWSDSQSTSFPKSSHRGIASRGVRKQSRFGQPIFNHHDI
jgi:hypothetical protein